MTTTENVREQTSGTLLRKRAYKEEEENVPHNIAESDPEDGQKFSRRCTHRGHVDGYTSSENVSAHGQRAAHPNPWPVHSNSWAAQKPWSVERCWSAALESISADRQYCGVFGHGQSLRKHRSRFAKRGRPWVRIALRMLFCISAGSIWNDRCYRRTWHRFGWEKSSGSSKNYHHCGGFRRCLAQRTSNLICQFWLSSINLHYCLTALSNNG